MKCDVGMMNDHDEPAKKYGNKVGCQVTKLKSHKQEEYTDTSLRGDQVIHAMSYPVIIPTSHNFHPNVFFFGGQKLCKRNVRMKIVASGYDHWVGHCMDDLITSQ